jgi:hypothetical protein
MTLAIFAAEVRRHYQKKSAYCRLLDLGHSDPNESRQSDRVLA